MKVALTAACLVLVLAIHMENADACGDKFVRVGRGGRYQRGYIATHPAAVLVDARRP